MITKNTKAKIISKTRLSARMSVSHSINADEQIMTESSLEQTNKNQYQQILLQGNDTSNTYQIFAKETDIIASKNSSQTRINASNKIKVNKIVNYEWEQRYNQGNMIAVHKSGQYFAYAIRVDNNGKVKVFNKKLNDKVLLKSFKGRVMDLSFAHCDSEILLGCVDETGCCQIFKISLDHESRIQARVVFNLAPLSQSPLKTFMNNGNENTPSKNLQTSNKNIGVNVNRIIWCMYIPDATNNAHESVTPSQDADFADDASKVFVLTRKSRADIFHLGLIEENYDCSVQLDKVDEITQGHLVIDDHNSNILAASFSPDGSAIATSSADGEVKFFKISFQPETYVNPEADGALVYETPNNEENDEEADNENNITPKQEVQNALNTPSVPKCLQRWKPHNDKPVTSIYFLDDHKNPSVDAQFWSFIVTGADYNREIKIWCCVKWECLQVIRFMPSATPAPPGIDADNLKNNLIMPLFKTSIDASSTHLVMSDVTRKCFYVLHLMKNPNDDVARCTAISEYILAYPAISFAIIDSSTRKARKYNQLNNVNSNASADESNFDSLTSESSQPQAMMSSSSSSSSLQQTAQGEVDLVTMIRLYCIQTKQLQEMQIFLTGEQSTNAYNNSSNSPPPAMQTQAFQFNSAMNTPQQRSLLEQLLPGTSPSASRFNSVNSLSSTDANLINSLTKLNLSNSNPHRMKTSGSFNSELKESLSKQTDDANYEVNNQSTNLSSSQSIIRSLLPNLKNSQSNTNFSEAEDSAIIQIVTPTPQMGNINPLATPVLLTPDAFINSPTNSRKSLNNEQQQSKPNDIFQTLMAGNSVNGNSSLANSINVTNSNNLISSRASSLTHVTAATNLGQNELSAYTNTNLESMQQIQTTQSLQNNQSSQKKLKGKKKEKKMNSIHRQRNDSCSSSCSSYSSSCMSSESSSASSIMDSADKEIAALSSSGNSKLVAQIGNATNGSANKQNNSSLNANKNESLLNKVSIENDDSYIGQSKSESEKQDFKLQSFGIQQQNESWPMPPLKNNFIATDASQHFQNGNSMMTSAGGNIYTSDSHNNSNVNDLKHLNANINELKSLLGHMTETLRTQHEEIENLKKHQSTSQNQLKSHIDTTFNKLMKSSHNSLYQSQQTDESSMINLMQQTLSKNLQPKLEKLIKEEIHKSVQNQFVTKLMEPLREQITRDLAEKLKSIEGVLKDSVVKLFKSKSTLDTLSQSIVNSQQATIVNSYRETFQKVIVPNFEKSCQNMYQQVNNSFSKGTQDYLVEFDTLAKQHSKKFDESKESILAQMNQFNDQMSNQTTQMANILANNLQQQFEANLRNTNAILQDTIISSVKAIIKEEIHLAMRDQQQTLPDHLITQMRQSGTMTPVNLQASTSGSEYFIQQNNNSQYQISQLLKKGQLNNAFQQALCAADLNLLENLCELVSPTQAFDPSNDNPKAKLQQPVILSLIQQLSQDLNSNTELKVKYLEEAIVNLDMTVALTVEHSPGVINTLINYLQQYIQTHPNDKYSKQMRMILLASRSLMQSKGNAPQKTQLMVQNQNAMGANNNSSNKLFMNGNSQSLNQHHQLTNQFKKNTIQPPHDNF